MASISFANSAAAAMKVDLSQIVNDDDDDDGHSETGGMDDSDKHQKPQRDDNALDKTLGKDETTALRALRLIVLLVLVAAAGLVSVAVYLYMKRDEEDEFEVQYYDLATRLVEGFQANTKLRLQVMDMLALSISSSAFEAQQAWPFVTIADFDARVSAARSILSSQYVAVYPYVTKEQRKEWEAYTQDPAIIQWTNESFAYQEDFLLTHNHSLTVMQSRRTLSSQWNLNFDGENGDPTSRKLSLSNNNITYDGVYGSNPQLYRVGYEDEGDHGQWVNEDEDAPGPFLPIWQVSPTLEDNIYASINYNILDPYYPESYTNSLLAVHSKGEAVFGGVWNVDDAGYIDENDDFDFRVVPAAALMYPIFDTVRGDKTVVAVTELDFEFGPFFTSVLPPNANSMTCVVSNCDQTFTFEVTGETATYLGYDDLHDTKYDKYVVSANMTDFDKSAGGTVYNGAPVNTDYCPWMIKVYATQDMEEAFVTSKPAWYMAAVLSVFLFTCLVFVLYDRLVERRQKKVMTTAVKSDKIVASLFPGTFRDAMYDQQQQQEDEETKEGNGGAFRKHNVSNFLRNDVVRKENHAPGGRGGGGEAMAQLYPQCTVFFADLAGFTSWSSTKTPSEVFTLLETLYGAFDKIANQLGVFKIETIGDCYVAVTGLPTPQHKHALIMARFASSCITKMNQIVNNSDILSALGENTANLAMRVGMHSGPVTAGVLRGEKARFQLFGDTVNTAARMESNGQKGRIQVSQETADLLTAAGKSRWLTAREDLVDAKGKGQMQCYWVDNIVPDKSVRSSSFMSASLMSTSAASSGISDDEEPRIQVSLLFNTGSNSRYDEEVEV